jgi:hypothetical protein
MTAAPNRRRSAVKAATAATTASTNATNLVLVRDRQRPRRETGHATGLRRMTHGKQESDRRVPKISRMNPPASQMYGLDGSDPIESTMPVANTAPRSRLDTIVSTASAPATAPGLTPTRVRQAVPQGERGPPRHPEQRS